MESKEKIAKAIITVMKAVKGMEKKSRIGSGQNAYDGTKDMDVKEIFNEEMAKAGLCIIPIGIVNNERVERWEEKTNYGIKQKQSVFTTVNTKYLLLHESGQSIELSGYGHGVDSQDKSAGKATTYALKNCLLLTFLTPVGKMPDTDENHSNEIEIVKKQPKTPTKPELIPGDANWDKVIAAIKGGYTINQIKSKYRISELNESKMKIELV